MGNTVTADVIAAFASVSGDRNPVHIDADYAADTMFKERIAHGMLSGAYISAVFGMPARPARAPSTFHSR